MLKIVVLTCAWQRHHITKLFLEQFKVLQNYKPTEIQLDLVVVCSEHESHTIVSEYTTHHIQYKNLPLGEKWNAGIEYCKDLDFDYVLILGSDDLLSVSGLDVYVNYIKQQHLFIGFEDFYVFCTYTKRMSHWSGYFGKRSGEPVGAGRLIHRSIVEAANFNLWNPIINRGLDNSTVKKLDALGFKPTTINARANQVVLVDIKSGTNLGAYEKYAGKGVTAKRILPHYFPELYRKILTTC